MCKNALCKLSDRPNQLKAESNETYKVSLKATPDITKHIILLRRRLSRCGECAEGIGRRSSCSSSRCAPHSVRVEHLLLGDHLRGRSAPHRRLDSNRAGPARRGAPHAGAVVTHHACRRRLLLLLDGRRRAPLRRLARELPEASSDRRSGRRSCGEQREDVLLHVLLRLGRGGRGRRVEVEREEVVLRRLGRQRGLRRRCRGGDRVWRGHGPCGPVHVVGREKLVALRLAGGDRRCSRGTCGEAVRRGVRGPRGRGVLLLLLCWHGWRGCGLFSCGTGVEHGRVSGRRAVECPPARLVFRADERLHFAGNVNGQHVTTRRSEAAHSLLGRNVSCFQMRLPVQIREMIAPFLD